MKRIKLTQGKFAIVDDEDFEWLSQWKWLYGAGKRAARTVNFPRVNGRKKTKTVFMHRMILPPASGYEVDHINRKPLDNRRCNLRVVTHAQNMMNSNGKRTRRCRYRGVHKEKVYGKYVAQISKDKKKYFLGHFTNQKDAHEAVRAWSIKNLGEFSPYYQREVAK